MFNDFPSSRGAERNRQIEVDREAARLIREQGIPLYEAVAQATKTVQERREQSNWEREIIMRLTS